MYSRKTHLIASVITALVAGVVVLGATTTPAQAAFPDTNGEIAFVHGEVGSGIYAVNPDVSGRTGLTLITAYGISPNDPAWSPDGTKIAFSSNPNKTRYSEIYIVDTDGSNLRRLTYNEVGDTKSDYREDRYPAWSPDGTKIAYNSYGDTGWEIFTMNADGSDQTQLTKDDENPRDIGPNGNLTRFRDNYLPAWSPDGKKIADEVSSQPGGSGIYTMNSDGSNPTLVIAEGGQPDWSPDGTKLVYRSNLAGKAVQNIYIADADGSNPVKLTANTDGAVYLQFPVWSPDGTKIAFSSNLDEKEEAEELYVIDADGRNLRRLTHTPDVDRSPDWQPLPRPSVPKSSSVTVHPPDTGGPSLLLIASVLLFSMGLLLHTMMRPKM
jgi:Tol biopolymer transport system component